jgi:hypothetical protein
VGFSLDATVLSSLKHSLSPNFNQFIKWQFRMQTKFGKIMDGIGAKEDLY